MHYRPVDEYFSPGFRNLLYALLPRGRTEVVFPSPCRDTRISAQEGVHPWFLRLAGNEPDDFIRRCAVEENMGVVAWVCYRDDLITHLSLQVLVTEADLTTFYCDSETPCSYFRLDYDLGCLGPLFKEPLPHIHSSPEGAPRFTCITPGGNVIVDFFDFIYRSFHHGLWVKWARRAYLNSARGAGEESDVFGAIESAFKASKHEVLLSDYREHLHRIKTACRALKDRLFSARLDPQISTLLTYDSA